MSKYSVSIRIRFMVDVNGNSLVRGRSVWSTGFRSLVNSSCISSVFLDSMILSTSSTGRVSMREVDMYSAEYLSLSPLFKLSKREITQHCRAKNNILKESCEKASLPTARTWFQSTSLETTCLSSLVRNSGSNRATPRGPHVQNRNRYVSVRPRTRRFLPNSNASKPCCSKMRPPLVRIDSPSYSRYTTTLWRFARTCTCSVPTSTTRFSIS